MLWGTNGDVPVPADYDSDGRTDLAVFRPSAGVSFVRPSGGGPESSTAWGTQGDIPAPGDYDRDGTADVAVFRPSAGLWFFHPNSATVWGTDGDQPLPLPAAVQQLLFGGG